VYPGSFDPITLGHHDIVLRSLRLVDRVIVAVAETATQEKRALFDLDERIELLEEVYRDEPRVTIASFRGLLVDFARAADASIIIRGLRAVSDFEYEFQMALMNRSLSPDIEVIFMTPANRYTFLSSSLVREVARLNGDVSAFVHPIVLEAIKRRVPAKEAGG
jgi:pantetheine-phosphate adenylyltransferase